MKKILITLLAFTLSCSAFAQDYIRNNKVFSEVKTQSSSADEKTDYIWKNKEGKTYEIYISRNNACYILKTSKKTGKTYKQYLPKEIANEIATELGRIKKK